MKKKIILRKLDYSGIRRWLTFSSGPKSDTDRELVAPTPAPAITSSTWDPFVPPPRMLAVDDNFAFKSRVAFTGLALISDVDVVAHGHTATKASATTTRFLLDDGCNINVPWDTQSSVVPSLSWGVAGTRGWVCDDGSTVSVHTEGSYRLIILI